MRWFHVPVVSVVVAFTFVGLVVALWLGFRPF